MTDAFPDKLEVFRRDQKKTFANLLDNNPEDWAWYVRADLYQELEAKLAAAEAKLQGGADDQ